MKTRDPWFEATPSQPSLLRARLLALIGVQVFFMRQDVVEAAQLRMIAVQTSSFDITSWF